MKHQLENKRFKVTIADEGAELCSIYDKDNEREIIWEANPAYWSRHAPVLFPNVGAQYNNEYKYNGQTYTTRQHGFARDTTFIRTNITDTSITHQMKDSNTTKQVFPFDFTLEITHTLQGGHLKVRWTVVNDGDNTMYFTIGAHPAFRVPALEGTKQSDYKLSFPNTEALEYILLDTKSGTAQNSTAYQLQLQDGMCNIAERMFDEGALIFDNSQIEQVTITYPDGKPYVSISCKGFPNFGIWTLPDAPFVCLEPWAGRCDDIGFVEDISNKADINKLESKETFKREYNIILH